MTNKPHTSREPYEAPQLAFVGKLNAVTGAVFSSKGKKPPDDGK